MLGSRGVGITVGIRELRAWLASAPAGTTVPAASILDLLDVDSAPEPQAPQVAPDPVPLTWAERLWLVPAETRLGTSEVLEALQRSRSWLYAQMAAGKGADRLPHRRLDGTLLFTAGELRAWVRAHEEVVCAGPMESTPTERHLQVHRTPTRKAT